MDDDPSSSDDQKNGDRTFERRIKQAIQEARAIVDLGDDWDGEGSPGYQKKTWAKAVDFTRRHLRWIRSNYGEDHAPIPVIGPGPQGAIDIHWRTDRLELLVTIPASDDAPATFYGDDYGPSTIKGSIDYKILNESIAIWLATQ